MLMKWLLGTVAFGVLFSGEAHAQFIDGVYDMSAQSSMSIHIDHPKKTDSPSTNQNTVKPRLPPRVKPMSFTGGTDPSVMNGPVISGPNGMTPPVQDYMNGQEIDKDASRPNYEACVHMRIDGGVRVADAIQYCAKFSHNAVNDARLASSVNRPAPVEVPHQDAHNQSVSIDMAKPIPSNGDPRNVVTAPLPDATPMSQRDVKINGVILPGYAPDQVDDPACNSQNIYVLLSPRCMRGAGSNIPRLNEAPSGFAKVDMLSPATQHHGVHLPEAVVPVIPVIPVAIPEKDILSVRCEETFKANDGSKSHHSWMLSTVKSCLQKSLSSNAGKYGTMEISVIDGKGKSSEAVCSQQPQNRHPVCRVKG